MRAAVCVLLAATLVAVAGCSAVFGPAETETETLSPGPTPSPVPQYPPGADSSGITAPFDLVDAHVDTLRDVPYTVVENRTLRYRNETVLRNRTERVQIAAEPDRYHYRLQSGGTVGDPGSGRGGTDIYYSNGSIAAMKRMSPDQNVSYRVFVGPEGAVTDPAELYHGSPSNGDRLSSLLSRADPSVVDAGDVIRFRANTFRGETLDILGHRVSNLTVTTFTATVRPDGVVRSYRLEFQGTVDGSPVVGVERVRYVDVATTTVEEPAWFDRAINESRALSIVPPHHIGR